MLKKKSKKKKPGIQNSIKRRKKALAKIPRCGLCGKMGNLIKTECCDEWICDDQDQYVVFSYARNSCYRNHSRFTLCGYHDAEGHSGHWKDCEKCKEGFSDNLEMYVSSGTNEYNFEKLENPPSYEPTKCCGCGIVIVLSDGGYSIKGGEYWCGKCNAVQLPDFTKKKKLTE